MNYGVEKLGMKRLLDELRKCMHTYTQVHPRTQAEKHTSTHRDTVLWYIVVVYSLILQTGWDRGMPPLSTLWATKYSVLHPRIRKSSCITWDSIVLVCTCTTWWVAPSLHGRHACLFYRAQVHAKPTLRWAGWLDLGLGLDWSSLINYFKGVHFNRD